VGIEEEEKAHHRGHRVHREEIKAGRMKKPLGHKRRAALSGLGCIYAGAGSIA